MASAFSDDAPIPRTAPPEEVLRASLDAVASGRSVAIATVVSRHGSAPATPGQKLAVAQAREAHAPLAVGTVGGGAIERAVLGAMFEALGAPDTAPRVHTFRLGPSLGMCCGGSADVLVEVLRPGFAVLLVGAGHVGLATARLLAELEFRVLLVDARDAATHALRTDEARALGVRVLSADHDDPEVLEALGAPADQSVCVVMTHDHQLDQAALEWALSKRFSFVGGVGSRAKAERTRQRLEAHGFPADDRARMRMPVGVSIGARRPTEIAVAIAAELVAHRARVEGTARTDKVVSTEPERPRSLEAPSASIPATRPENQVR